MTRTASTPAAERVRFSSGANALSGDSCTRRVLMISYYFPPIVAAGTQRSAAFATLLPRFGWQPLILTVRRSRIAWEARGGSVPDGVEVVRTHEWNLHRGVVLATAAIRRTLALFRRGAPRSLFHDLCPPDPQVAWFTTLPGLWHSRGCDCIYASCSPFSSALSGCLIRLITGKPLVLDFRDAWWPNPHKRLSAFGDALVRRLEAWVLRCCDALVVNSPGAEQLYRDIYPQYAAKIVAIPNGFDRLTPCHRSSVSGPFRIVHVGDFYRSRSPHQLLDVLSELQLPDVEFVQLGDGLPDPSQYQGVSIRRLDKVPHGEALHLMSNASLLYLKQAAEPGVVNHVAIASKTYEYLATGLPVLAECPPGDNANLLQRYAARAYVITSGAREDLKAAVLRAYSERDRPAGITPEFATTFDRLGLTARLARVLDLVACPGRCPTGERSRFVRARDWTKVGS